MQVAIGLIDPVEHILPSAVLLAFSYSRSDNRREIAVRRDIPECPVDDLADIVGHKRQTDHDRVKDFSVHAFLYVRHDSVFVCQFSREFRFAGGDESVHLAAHLSSDPVAEWVVLTR